MVSNLNFNPHVYNRLGIQRSAVKKQSPSFCGGVSTLTHTNIGMCADGFIGKIRVRLGDGGEAFFNVIKKKMNQNLFMKKLFTCAKNIRKVLH